MRIILIFKHCKVKSLPLVQISTINSTLNTKANSSAPSISIYLNNIGSVGLPVWRYSGAYMALGSNLTSGHVEGNFINTATFSQSSLVMAFNFSKLLTITTKSDLLSISNTGNATLIGVVAANDVYTNGNNPITSLNNTIANLTQTDNLMMLQISNNINSINALNASVNNINNALDFKADLYGYVGCYFLDGVVSSKSFNKYPVFSSEGNLGPSINNQADALILMSRYLALLYTEVNYTGNVESIRIDGMFHK